MLRGPRVFLITILVMAVVVIGYRFHQYLLASNFLVLANTACDPTLEECFAMDCNPEEDEDCDTTPYKKVELVARDAPQCLLEHTCVAFSCTGIEECSVTYCGEDTLEEGEVCAEAPVVEQAPEETEPEGEEPVEESSNEEML